MKEWGEGRQEGARKGGGWIRGENGHEWEGTIGRRRKGVGGSRRCFGSEVWRAAGGCGEFEGAERAEAEEKEAKKRRTAESGERGTKLRALTHVFTQ